MNCEYVMLQTVNYPVCRLHFREPVRQHTSLSNMRVCIPSPLWPFDEERLLRSFENLVKKSCFQHCSARMR